MPPHPCQQICLECFYYVFETEVHNTIVQSKLFTRGEKVAIGASGGKDSTVLAYVMKTLNDRYDYGIDLYLLSIDEGITGYRDASLDTVKQNADEYQLPLLILPYNDLYGWTMDRVVGTIGKKNNCTYCGVFRRQALDRGAAQLGVNHIVTGHNADDIAETVLMNIMRGDIARLGRCTEICTAAGAKDADGNVSDTIKRSKPFKYAYEKEIVMYAYFKQLTYHSTECIYSPEAYRGHARAFLKDLEKARPSAIVDVIYAGERMIVRGAEGEEGRRKGKAPKALQTCTRCGYMSSNELCKACTLLEGLEKTAAAAQGNEDGNMRTIPFFQRSVKAEDAA